MKVTHLEGFGLRSEIEIAMGARIAIPLNGIRCDRESALISFRLPNLALPLILQICLVTETSTWSVGSKMLQEPLPWSCERSDIWRELVDYSIQGIQSDNLVRVDAELREGRLCETYEYFPEGQGRTLVRIVMLDAIKEEVWIEVDNEQDAVRLRNQFFASLSPNLDLAKWAVLGWRDFSKRPR